MFKGYYKMPAAQTDTENCVAHNGSLDPGARAATSWCSRGTRAACRCSTSPIRPTPVEIAFFDRGPINPKELVTGGYWSSYWYNGNIYGAEISRGIDVFRLLPSEHLSENEIAAAKLVRFEEFNSQNQPTLRVAAELRRGQGLSGSARCAPRPSTPARAKTLRAALDQGDTRADADARRARQAWPPSSRRDAAAPGAADAKRYKAMAEAINARTARLR